jgi:hypothetical protein
MKIINVANDINSQAKIVEANYCQKATQVDGNTEVESAAVESTSEEETEKAQKKVRKTKRVQSEEV